MALDVDTVNQIAHDVGLGKHPGAGYTTEMREAWYRMYMELQAFRQETPDAFVHVPPGIEGIPGPKEERADYSPDQPREPDGKFGEGGGVGSKVAHFFGFGADKKEAPHPDDHIAKPDTHLLTSEQFKAQAAQTKVEMTAYRAKNAEFYSHLTPNQSEALQFYTGEGYHEMSRTLRDPSIGLENASSREAKRIHDIDTAIAHSKLDQDTTLWRGVTAKDVLKNPKIGSVITDNGFVSTTDSKATAMGFSRANTIVEIHAPKGATAAPISNDLLVEREWLLPRGSKFKITGVSTIPGTPDREEWVDGAPLKIKGRKEKTLVQAELVS